MSSFYDFFSHDTFDNDRVVASFYRRIKKKLDDKVRSRQTSFDTNLWGNGIDRFYCMQKCNPRLKNF